MRYVLEALLIATAATGGWMLATPSPSIGLPTPDSDRAPGTSTASAKANSPRKAKPGGTTRSFGFCHSGGGTNCVVDGDNFWMDGEKIRISDIDAPETHPPRCPEEARLGDAATQRLRALLNAGPVELETGDRATDKYGRALRIVTRDGQSLGDQLVGEGLARRWIGYRQPWC